MSVLRCDGLPAGSLNVLLRRFGLALTELPMASRIPGSYWGEPEAGVIGSRLYVRDDTPVHSALHEACHVICMTPDRRARLHEDAGGGFDEENGVCYLQVILSDYLPSVGRDRIFRDMDAWGYSFRLGSAADWFHRDAADTRAWLRDLGLIDELDRPTWKMRGDNRTDTDRSEGAKSR